MLQGTLGKVPVTSKYWD